MSEPSPYWSESASSVQEPVKSLTSSAEAPAAAIRPNAMQLSRVSQAHPRRRLFPPHPTAGRLGTGVPRLSPFAGLGGLTHGSGLVRRTPHPDAAGEAR